MGIITLRAYKLLGTSLDTKPYDAPHGSEFYETDTGTTYVYNLDTAAWVVKNTNAIKIVDGKPRYSSMPYLYDISEGNVSGHSIWSKSGYNADVDSGTEDMWAVGGTYVFPPSAMQMEVVSSDANDTGLGSGVKSVQITYLDNTYAEKTEIVALTGTVAAATVATNILRINNFRAYTVGTGKKAAGNIDIRETDDSPIYGRIPLGFTRARNSAYTVPLGKTLYITSARFSAIGAAVGKDVIFTARCTYDDKRLTVLDFFMPFIEIGVMDGGIQLDFEIPIKLPATVDIYVSGTAGNDNTFCTSALRGWTE